MAEFSGYERFEVYVSDGGYVVFKQTDNLECVDSQILFPMSLWDAVDKAVRQQIQEHGDAA